MYDIVADCSDNVPTRYLVNDACVLARKPLVSASALRMEGQVSSLFSIWIKPAASELYIDICRFYLQRSHVFDHSDIFLKGQFSQK